MLRSFYFACLVILFKTNNYFIDYVKIGLDLDLVIGFVLPIPTHKGKCAPVLMGY